MRKQRTPDAAELFLAAVEPPAPTRAPVVGSLDLLDIDDDPSDQPVTIDALEPGAPAAREMYRQLIRDTDEMIAQLQQDRAHYAERLVALEREARRPRAVNPAGQEDRAG